MLIKRLALPNNEVRGAYEDIGNSGGRRFGADWPIRAQPMLFACIRGDRLICVL
ncbi:hypothetical protein SH591_08815 [Sphingomonas sp. LY54]|uniref:hypothetical protein n=1 Tax=Sphingomonas sp. LY54 TaxID=3095343 RepID=UPI002D7854EE|nr:hypothetical protein [Sphingomonas sp. LY54]WRP27225.1 hypothetical protein SH591_08815 [Sphingomonas sp. LY54]